MPPFELKKRIGILGLGLSANWTISWAFDFILYPFVIYIFGILWGGLTMTILSFLVCYATILFYDWSKQDWIGIETMKGIKGWKSKNKIGNFFIKLIRKSDPLAMIILSVQFDPFITTAYLRQGAHQYNGLSRRDWKIFIGSIIIGNIYWTLAAFMGITLLEALVKFFIA